MTTATQMTTDATLAGDDNIYCDCGAALTDEEIDNSGYECNACYAKTHFTCCDCGDTFDNEEVSSKCKTRCSTCQETKDEEELEAKKDALRSEAEDLLASILIDGDLAALKKTIAALKRFQPT